MDIDIQKNAGELHIPEETYSRIVKLSFTQSDQDIEELEKAIQDKNSENIKTLAHRIKGVYSNLRLRGVFDPAEEINELAKSNSGFEKMLELFSILNAEYMQIKDTFK